MNDTVEKYSADALALVRRRRRRRPFDDANFSREMADNTILSLINEDTWITETPALPDLRTSGDLN
jgi:hypothetical protein